MTLDNIFQNITLSNYLNYPRKMFSLFLSSPLPSSLSKACSPDSSGLVLQSGVTETVKTTRQAAVHDATGKKKKSFLFFYLKSVTAYKADIT